MAPRKVTRFVYKFVQAHIARADDLEELLNDFGADGWEVVECKIFNKTFTGRYVELLLKRAE